MSPYRTRFDAKRYWAAKPYCTVCHKSKVKNGSICHACKKADMKKTRKSSVVEEEVVLETEASMDVGILDAEKTVAPREPSISTEAQNKITRLFTYLEKALALDDSVVRDFRTTATAPSLWWLGDLPQDVDNLYIRPFDTETGQADLKDTNAWLEVEKKNIKPPPALSERLLEWVEAIDNPIATPQGKEKVDRQVRFDDEHVRVQEFKQFRKDFEQGDKVPARLKEWVVLDPSKLPDVIDVKYTEDRWADHPELQHLLKGYVENEWEPWASKVRKIYKANLLYDQLYALRLLLKNEGDSYELLLGHGLLSWQHKAVGAIYAPVFLTQLTLEFDAAKRVITLAPDPMFKGFAETSALYETDNPAEMDLVTWSDRINAVPFDFWHFETLKSQAQTLVNYLSPESEDHFESNFAVAPPVTKNPAIWNAPVIFARKRTNDLWSKYAGFIRRDIEQNGVNATEFITDLVGEYHEVDGRERGEGERETAEKSIKEAELFFPLPWNDEQKRIAERLDANYGVVVKGPPGTGKSHTIANLISRFLAQGKTVLVTSQTSKALEVLRDKLPENIRSLAVSQLHQTARRDDILQQSISEISSNLGERHTKFSEQRAESIKRDLQRVREQKALLANQIRQYILTDSSERVEMDGEELKPIEAAKLVSKYKDDEASGWFNDTIGFDTALTFNEDDLKELYALALDLESKDRTLYKFQLPALSDLPTDEVASGAFSAYRELSAKAKATDKPLGGASFSQSELSTLWEQLLNARKILGSINQGYEKEIFAACATSQSEREKWQAVLTKLSQKVKVISASNSKIIGHVIEGPLDLSSKDLLDSVEALQAKISNKTRLGAFGKMLLSANAKKVLETYRVDSRAPDNPERVGVLQHAIAARVAEKEVRVLLDQCFASLKSSPLAKGKDLNIVQLEVLAATLEKITNYPADFVAIDEFCKKTKVLSDLSYLRKDDVETITGSIVSRVAKFELLNLDDMFSHWQDSIKGESHPIVNKLFSAIAARNATAWRNGLTELGILVENKTKAVRLNEISQRMQPVAPNLYQDVIDLADSGTKFDCPDNLALVWKVARLESWLSSVHDHVDIDDLQSQLERLTKREHELNSDYVTILSWQRQIDKVTKRQRDALMAWSESMRKYGKGTGKYATKWLRAAQESLKEAKNAVPVWIMPLHRAAQMFAEPQAGLFDVVIFDEASQCDIRGITIGYLGKKLLVVGDPDQISPAGIFQDQERIFELISRFLSDIPHKDTFSITSSFFDLAKIRIPNMIQLNEHFRCVPEIIAFSNYHIYEGHLKPLRYPHPKGMLKPALVPVYVEKGYQNTNNKVNEPEAEAIVAKLLECLKDPAYDKRPDGRPCTFGIISLLAEDQAKYIEKLIRDRIAKGEITEKEIEERRIECGDAYKFQGDERDVMFLSMVRALNPNELNDTVAPLVDQGARRRFNVAASRARDQMFLFHSIPLE